MIGFKVKGDFSNATNYLEKMRKASIIRILEKYGEIGVKALSEATPVDTGLTAASWSYKIQQKPGSILLTFHNSNVNKGVPIAIILQYGHGTATGGWVEGRDYINPAMQPIFDKLSKDVWEEVIKL